MRRVRALCIVLRTPRSRYLPLSVAQLLSTSVSAEKVLSRVYETCRLSMFPPPSSPSACVLFTRIVFALAAVVLVIHLIESGTSFGGTPCSDM